MQVLLWSVIHTPGRGRKVPLGFAFTVWPGITGPAGTAGSPCDDQSRLTHRWFLLSSRRFSKTLKADR